MMNGRCPRGHYTVTMSLDDEDDDHFDADECGGPGDDHDGDHDIITIQLNLKPLIAYLKSHCNSQTQLKATSFRSSSN